MSQVFKEAEEQEDWIYREYILLKFTLSFFFYISKFQSSRKAWEELKNKYRNNFLQNQVYPIYFRFIIISYVQLVNEMK